MTSRAFYLSFLCDDIVVPKSSTGEGKFTLCGWGYYFPHTPSTDLHNCDYKHFDWILHKVDSMCKRRKLNVLE